MISYRWTSSARRSSRKPVENAFIESFNGKLRDEYLNSHVSDSVVEAQVALDGWREDYNVVRPQQLAGSNALASAENKLNAGATDPSSRRFKASSNAFPVGIDAAGRPVLLYLVTVPWTDEFRTFVQAQAAFLRGVPEWTGRLVFPRPLDRAYESYRRVIHEELNALQRGDAFETLSSPGLGEALASGAGRVECLVLPHSYRHLSPLVSLVRSTPKGVEKGEHGGERLPPCSQPLPSPPPPASLTVTEQLERDWYRLVGRS
jgi:integrase-like protein